MGVIAMRIEKENTIHTSSINNTYFQIVHNIYDDIELCIKWNIKDFISLGSMTGFIVQHIVTLLNLPLLSLFLADITLPP